MISVQERRRIPLRLDTLRARTQLDWIAVPARECWDPARGLYRKLPGLFPPQIRPAKTESHTKLRCRICPLAAPSPRSGLRLGVLREGGQGGGRCIILALVQDAVLGGLSQDTTSALDQATNRISTKGRMRLTQELPDTNFHLIAYPHQRHQRL
jgi:hypothetical protein